MRRTRPTLETVTLRSAGVAWSVAGAGDFRGFTHLPGPGPALGKARGPLGHIAGRGKPARVAGPAYGPLAMPDPRPGRPPAKAAPGRRGTTEKSRSR